ncbi:MAG: SH3 domain-containing protein [Chloroflexi bacterium]|nr:SH3 domain-containing protein [Chloroflexota bacterium]
MTRVKRGLILTLIVLLGAYWTVGAQEAGDLLFEDDFESSKDLPGWLYADHFQARVVTDGENRALRLVGVDDAVAEVYIEEGAEWEDYTLELRLQIVRPTEDRAGFDAVLILRYDEERSESNGVLFNSGGQFVRLAAFVGGDFVELAEEEVRLREATWYRLRVEVRGDNFSLAVDGEMVAEAESEEQSQQGTVGFLVGPGATVLIDDVRVRAAESAPQVTVNDAIDAIIEGSVSNDNDNDNDNEGNDGSEAEVVASAQVTVSSANLRSGPGTQFAVIDTAARGTRLDVIAQSGSGDDLWYLVVGDDPGVETWISATTVRLIPPDAEIPDIEDIGG